MFHIVGFLLYYANTLCSLSFRQSRGTSVFTLLSGEVTGGMRTALDSQAKRTALLGQTRYVEIINFFFLLNVR